MIQFATKLLTIANNEILLTDSDEGNNLAGALSIEGQKQLDRYVLFLQAVGNAILVQADELRRREAYIAEIADEGAIGAERAAVARALARLRCLRTEENPSEDAGEGNGVCTPEESIFGTELDNVQTTVEVLDVLIAELRYLEIGFAAELATSPEGCATISDIVGRPDRQSCYRLLGVRAALKTAYEHRAGLVYIRPPGAYLRTGFAATGLQQSANLAWRNMLTEHYWRGQIGRDSPLRFLPGDNKYETERDRIETLSEIDKIFWQNINSVRLARAGDTGYVLVKDDIGNWYVKGLEADTSSIVRGIRANALFALGAPLNANLIEMMAIRDSLNELDPGAPASDRDPLLEQLRDLERRNQGSNRSGGGVGVDGSLGTALTGFESEYSNRAAADFADLDVALEPQEFHRTLRAAWSDAMARTPNLVDARTVPIFARPCSGC